MTAEQLLAPRYKVIADYPGNRFKVGAIFTKDTDSTFVDEQGNVTLESNLVTFTNIFKLLQWWERREISDMPKYVKFVKEWSSFKKGMVFKYDLWSEDGFDRNHIEFDTESGKQYHHAGVPGGNHIMPATQSEYDHYIKSKEK